MKKYTPDEYQEIFDELPEKVKTAFWDPDVSKRARKTSSRFNLSSEESYTLLRLVGHIFLGITPPSQIKKEVQDSFPEDIVENLYHEVIRFIIYPTQKVLREIYSDEEFKEIGVSADFKEEDKKWRSDFGDSYRETID